VARISDEAQLVSRRLDQALAAVAVMNHLAVSAVLSKDVAKEFNRLTTELAEG
jgi:hypothetical protein